MAAKGRIHRALPDITGLELKKVVFLLWPPGEAITGFRFDLILKGLNPEEHVHPQDFIVREKILAARAP
jgi:hypothetical protein